MRFARAVFAVVIRLLSHGVTALVFPQGHRSRDHQIMSNQGDDTVKSLPRIISVLEDQADGGSDARHHQDNILAAAARTSPMHWILHWDINETILVGDESGGDTREDCFNKIIAKSAFVRMTSAEETINGHQDLCDYDNTSAMTPTHWWDGSPLSADESKGKTIPPLYTGWDWPKGCCPYYRTSYKRIAKGFVTGHGLVYKPLYNEIEKRLTTTQQDNSTFKNIIPAFFHTIYKLVHSQDNDNDKNNNNNIAETSRKDPPVTIVFRTFGTDLPNIAKAMTAFAQGKHPDYPDFIHPEYELDSSQLYHAKWEPQDPGFISAPNKDKEYFQYQLYSQDDGSMVASGDQQVLDLLHNTSSGKQYVFGIQDDYPMWKAHNWEPWAGKPIWMTDNSNHHHILLDDNIHNLPHDGIASVRRPIMTPSSKAPLNTQPNFESDACFESLSGSEIQSMHGLHLIRVPTIEPILNKDWFLQQIQKVQASAFCTRAHSS